MGAAVAVGVSVSLGVGLTFALLTPTMGDM